MTGHEVELDQHAHATRSLSALLSAALAASQAAAQVSAQRARATAQRADQQTRQAEQVSREQREQARLAQQQAERQQRATQNVQHRQWSLKPTAQWLHDKPLSAAAAWASADVARDQDPAAARHAEQWEAIFKQEGVDVDQVRADAPTAVAAVEQGPTPPEGGGAAEPVELAGELAAVEVASGAVLAGAADVAHAAAATAHQGEAAAQWTAYADGEPAAALGGRCVSTPPSQVFAKSREAPDLAATTADSAARSLELVTTTRVER